MAKPVLSIGMIFKNDIRSLERCLKSLDPLREAVPCELVMADTGSTDGSRAVAERYADLLIDFPWVNDFSAARNAALEKCTGEWYLTIDSDEWLDPDFKDLVKFLKGKSRNKYDLAASIGRNYGDKQLKTYGDFYTIRMGRRRGGELYYQGAIHESLSFRKGGIGAVLVLPNLIFHHDGYLELSPGHTKAKLHRNMELLRAELEKEPDNLRTLIHCVDSAENKKERREYTDRLREAARNSHASGMIFESLSYQRCMHIYYDDGENDLSLACYREWKERCPESALVRVDGEAMAAALYYRMNEYAETLTHIGQYQKGLQEIKDGKDVRRTDRLYGQYNTDNLRWRSNLAVIRFYCLCALQNDREANEFLRSVKQEELLLTDRGAIVLKVLKEAERFPDGPQFLSACWKYNRDKENWEAAEEAVNQVKATQDFIYMLQEHIDKNGQAGIALIAQMDGLPGLCARIMLTEEEEERENLLVQIKDWEWVLPGLYTHTMDLRKSLPEAFYRQPSEWLASLAADLAKNSAFSSRVLDWITHTSPPETPGQLTWQLDLITAALRTSGWTENLPLGEGLCGRYADLSATYLDTVYNPNLLNEESLSILPGMHRFAWHYLAADLLNRSLTVTQNTNFVVYEGQANAYRQDSVTQRVFVPMQEPLREELCAFHRLLEGGDALIAQAADANRALDFCAQIIQEASR